MKLCFIHDFKVLYNPLDKNYYSVGFSYKIWQRYLKEFDELMICSRYEEITDVNGKILASGEDVSFYPIFNYKNPSSLLFHSKDIYKELENNILLSDAVLIRLPSILGFIAAHICKKNNKPYMVEVVGSIFDSYYYHGNIFGKILSLPMNFIQKKAVLEASSAVYVTQSYLQNKYPSKGLVYNGVSNVQLDNFSDDLTIKNLNTTCIKIGLIGSTYVNYKGHEYALKVIRQLIDRGFNVHLELVGQGLSDKLKNIIKINNLEKNVVYKGIIYDKEILDKWYKSLDFYIQPSKTEGHCRSIVEAIGNNVVTFASRVGGNSDSVSEKYLFNPFKPHELVELLSKSIENYNLRYENVKENKDNIKKYNIQIIEQYRNLALSEYKNLVLKQW